MAVQGREGKRGEEVQKPASGKTVRPQEDMEETGREQEENQECVV